jgi:hypothetical protein
VVARIAIRATLYGIDKIDAHSQEIEVRRRQIS